MIHLHNDPDPVDDEIQGAIMYAIDEAAAEAEERLEHGEVPVSNGWDHPHPILPPPLPDDHAHRKVGLDSELQDAIRTAAKAYDGKDFEKAVEA